MGGAGGDCDINDAEQLISSTAANGAENSGGENTVENGHVGDQHGLGFSSIARIVSNQDGSGFFMAHSLSENSRDGFDSGNHLRFSPPDRTYISTAAPDHHNEDSNLRGTTCAPKIHTNGAKK